MSTVTIEDEVRERVELVVNSSLDPAFLIDVSGQIISLNKEANFFFGWINGELIGSDFFSVIVPPELMDTYKESLLTFVQTGKLSDLIQRIEFISQSREFTEVSLELSVAPLIIKEQYYFNICIRDLTQVKHAEQESSKFFNQSLDLICLANTEGYFLRVNPTFKKTLGYSEAELLSRPFLDFVHPDDLEATLFEIEKLKTGLPTIQFENRYQCQDGSYKWLSWKSTSDPAKGILYAIARDVTERKFLLEKLKHTNSLQKAILDSTRYSIIATDTEGLITAFNAGAEKMLGYKRSEFLNLTNAVVIHDFEEIKEKARLLSEEFGREIKPDMEAFVVKANMGEPDTSEWNYIHKNGMKIPVLLTVSALKDDENNITGYVGIARDITHEKASSKRKLMYMREIEEKNKELDDFAYVISHDLKAPLRAISTLTDWIFEGNFEQLDEEGKEYFGLLKSRVGRMHALIEGVLEYSRAGREREPREDVDFNQLVQRVIHTFMLDEHTRIEVLNKLPVIKCNAVRMNQVFLNLIGNAIKYGDKECTIIKIDYQLLNDEHVFSVADNGPGIEPKYHEKAFSLFQTLQSRDTIESTGVGLSLVKKIVEMHGGSVRIESEKDQGVNFIFTIKN